MKIISSSCSSAPSVTNLTAALLVFTLFSLTPDVGFANGLVSNSTMGAGKLQTNQVIAIIPVGTNPSGIAVSPDSSTVYVSNSYDQTVSVIDAATDTVKFVIPATNPNKNLGKVAISPDGKTLYLLTLGYMGNAGIVVVVSTVTQAVVATVTVEWGPNAVAVNPNGKQVYVVNSGDSASGNPTVGLVSIISTSTNKEVIALLGGNSIAGAGVAFDRSGKNAYVTTTNLTGKNPRSFLWRIDTSSRKAVKQLSLGAGGISVLSLFGDTLYAAKYSKILFIDTQSDAIVDHVSFAQFLTGDGASLDDMAVAPHGKSLYALVSGPISQNGPGVLLTIDTATARVVGSTIAVGHYPSSVAVAPDGKRAYVANWYDNNVSVIDISSGG